LLIRPMKPADFEDLEETFFSFFPEVEADPGFGLTLNRQKPTMEEERVWFSGLLKDVEAGNVLMTGRRRLLQVFRIPPGHPLSASGLRFLPLIAGRVPQNPPDAHVPSEDQRMVHARLH
jgi:hypothetical protein